LLVMIGATTPEALREKRPYIIVGAFVMGMLLTPPDMISQTLLAIPIWLLFEVGVFASRYMLKRKADAARAGEELDMESELDRAEADEQGLNRDA